MIRHIVVWSFADDKTYNQNHLNAVKIKNELEYLQNIIDGIISLEVIIDPLSSSDGDIILNSLFQDEETLKRYQIHPEHKKISEFVKNNTKNRYCIDYIE